MTIHRMCIQSEDELSMAGALRQKPVELVKCVWVNEYTIANAEYVIEGEIVPGVKAVEDQNSHTGYAMPKFPGYNGHASSKCRLIKAKAVNYLKFKKSSAAACS